MIEAEAVAGAYFDNTVFEVVSLELKNQTENEIVLYDGQWGAVLTDSHIKSMLEGKRHS